MEKFIAFFSLWVARIALSVLAIAGLVRFLGGVDPVIVYPVAVIGVGFLLKETL